MKKWLKVSALAAAIGAVSVAAWAATLSNASGQSCGGASGVWHFVNNQTGGVQTPGTLTATWSSGDTCTTNAYQVNANMQHFNCVGTYSGTLIAGATNLPGRLVLSHFTCGEPPKCDPKVEKCD
jgi:hypothetical protein